MKTKYVITTLTIIFALVLAGCATTESPTGAASACPYGQEPIQYSLGSYSDKGSKGLILGTKEVDVPVTNKANAAVSFQVTIDCKTLDDYQPGIKSEIAYILPGDTYTFTLQVDADRDEDWECYNYRVSAPGTNGCILKQQR